MKSPIIDIHDASAKEYDDISVHVGSHGHEVLFGLAYEYVKPGESILDVGIGTGLSSLLFHKAGLKVYGIDGSGRMLDICREKGFAQELKQHDLSSGGWPYADGQFDHAICCGVFHFFKDPEVFFKESARILKRNGTFGFTVIEAADEERPDNDDNAGIAVYRHSEEHVQRLTRSHGLIILKKVSFYIFKSTEKMEKILFSGYITKRR